MVELVFAEIFASLNVWIVYFTIEVGGHLNMVDYGVVFEANTLTTPTGEGSTFICPCFIKSLKHRVSSDTSARAAVSVSEASVLRHGMWWVQVRLLPEVSDRTPPFQESRRKVSSLALLTTIHNTRMI